MESVAHRNLVQALADNFRTRGFIVTHVAGDPSLPDPPRLGRHEPDVIAHDGRNAAWIGEAKTGNGDIDTAHSVEQYEDFAKAAPGQFVIASTARGLTYLQLLLGVNPNLLYALQEAEFLPLAG